MNVLDLHILCLLKKPRRQNETSVDAVAKALSRFEEHTKYTIASRFAPAMMPSRHAFNHGNGKRLFQQDLTLFPNSDSNISIASSFNRTHHYDPIA